MDMIVRYREQFPRGSLFSMLNFQNEREKVT